MPDIAGTRSHPEQRTVHDLVWFACMALTCGGRPAKRGSSSHPPKAAALPAPELPQPRVWPLRAQFILLRLSPRAVAAAPDTYSPVSVSWHAHSDNMQAPLHARHAAICGPMVNHAARPASTCCSARRRTAASPSGLIWRAGSSRCAAACTAAAAAARRAACCRRRRSPASTGRRARHNAGLFLSLACTRPWPVLASQCCI